MFIPEKSLLLSRSKEMVKETTRDLFICSFGSRPPNSTSLSVSQPLRGDRGQWGWVILSVTSPEFEVTLRLIKRKFETRGYTDVT